VNINVESGWGNVEEVLERMAQEAVEAVSLIDCFQISRALNK
jgi:hypothetical protein